MKGNVTRGSGFRGVLDYAFDEGLKATGDKNAELVGGTMCGTDPRSLSAEFGHTRRIRKDIKRPVWHCSLALPAGDRLTGPQWEEIAANFLKKMGFPPDTQWVAVRHQDTDYDHIHIIASRVSLSGQVWYGQHEAFKAIEATQELEREHGLTITQGLYDEPQEKTRIKRGELEMWRATGQVPPKLRLEGLILEAAKGQPTVVQFADRLAAAGIEVRANLASTGKFSGFSFVLDGIKFKGSKINKACGWTKLQENQGVTYDVDRDYEALSTYRARKQPAVEGGTASDRLTATSRGASELAAAATAAARLASDAVAGSSDDVQRIQKLGATVDRVVAGARSAESEERHQRLRATIERALAAATAATANLKQLEHDSGRAGTALQRSVFGYYRTRQTAAKLGEGFDVGAGQLGVIGRRAAVQRGQKRRNAGHGSAPNEVRSGAAAVGDQCDRIAALGKRIARAAEALSAVRVLVQAPEPERRLAETAAVTDDALDAALAAAVSKAQQHQVEQDIPQPQRPVIESTEIDLERDPLAQPASPLPVQRGVVLMNATSGEPYRAPSADQLAEWQRELDSRPEPTDDELVDLVPEGLAEALELLDEQQDEDGIDLDELNDGPSGPSFG